MILLYRIPSVMECIKATLWHGPLSESANEFHKIVLIHKLLWSKFCLLIVKVTDYVCDNWIIWSIFSMLTFANKIFQPEIYISTRYVVKFHYKFSICLHHDYPNKKPKKIFIKKKSLSLWNLSDHACT